MRTSVADLRCQHCDKLLIKDGMLKCARCKIVVPATLGERRILCPRCRDPRMLLMKRDQAACPRCGRFTPANQEISERRKEMPTYILEYEYTYDETIPHEDIFEARDDEDAFEKVKKLMYDHQEDACSGSFGLKRLSILVKNFIESPDDALAHIENNEGPRLYEMNIDWTLAHGVKIDPIYLVFRAQDDEEARCLTHELVENLEYLGYTDITVSNLQEVTKRAV